MKQFEPVGTAEQYIASAAAGVLPLPPDTNCDVGRASGSGPRISQAFVFGDRRGRDPVSRSWLNLVMMDRCCVFQSVAKAIDEMICFTNPACFHT